MMSRKLIDGDRLKKEIHENDIMGGLNYAWYIDHAELVDAVEVVRCKDCKYKQKCPTKIFGEHSDDWFCADGERRE